MKLNCARTRRLLGALVSLFTLLAIATITTPALPRASDGNIVGTVTDQSGAGIPNATVDLVNSATDDKISPKTSADGSFGFGTVLGRITQCPQTAALTVTLGPRPVGVKLRCTELSLAAHALYRSLYRAHGNMENRIMGRNL